MSITTAD